MPRPEKVAAVAEIKERIQGARAVFLAEYAGLSVKQQQELRRGLRDKGAEFKVVKMTLARRAAADLELAELDELLIGPTGLAFADADAVSAAKVLKDFAAAHEVFAVKGGLLGTDFLTPERIGALAEIAPREELLAMIAGAMKAPMTAMAGLLAALPRGAATVMQQLLEKKQAGEFVSGAAPDADAAVTAAAADEADADEAAAGEAGAEADGAEAAAATGAGTAAAEAEPADDGDGDAGEGGNADDDGEDATAHAAATDESDESEPDDDEEDEPAEPVEEEN